MSILNSDKQPAVFQCYIMLQSGYLLVPSKLIQ